MVWVWVGRGLGMDGCGWYLVYVSGCRWGMAWLSWGVAWPTNAIGALVVWVWPEGLVVMGRGLAVGGM